MSQALFVGRVRACAQAAPSLTYIASTAAGEVETNHLAGAVNALSWGVFPGTSGCACACGWGRTCVPWDALAGAGPSVRSCQVAPAAHKAGVCVQRSVRPLPRPRQCRRGSCGAGVVVWCGLCLVTVPHSAAVDPRARTFHGGAQARRWCSPWWRTWAALRRGATRRLPCGRPSGAASTRRGRPPRRCSRTWRPAGARRGRS